MRIDKSYMIVIPHFKLYPALFPLKLLICIPKISAVRGNVVFETLHDFYWTAITLNKTYRPIGLNLTHTVAYNSRKEQQLNSVLFIVLHTV